MQKKYLLKLSTGKKKKKLINGLFPCKIALYIYTHKNVYICIHISKFIYTHI